MARIGLVAGSGRLPVIFSDIARAKGDEVIAFGIKGITDDGLEKSVDKIHWLAWGDLKKAMMLLLMERVKKIVLLGKISKEMVFKQTGNLDTEIGESVITLLFDVHKQNKTTLVVVTHDEDLAKRCDRMVTIHDGTIS